jgi:hypothetical protein
MTKSFIAMTLDWLIDHSSEDCEEACSMEKAHLVKKLF